MIGELETRDKDIEREIDPAKLDAELESTLNAMCDLRNNLGMFVRCLDAYEKSTSHTDTSSMSRSDLKLPRLDLPTFDGNYLSWTSFWELFDACVHRNESLSNIERMQYLQKDRRTDKQRILKAKISHSSQQFPFQK